MVETKVLEEVAVIELDGKEVTTKDGKKFISWKAFDKNGKKYDVHFKKEVQGIPTTAGHYNMCIPYTDFNVKKDKYNTMWVGGSPLIEPYKIDEAAIAEMNKELF